MYDYGTIFKFRRECTADLFNTLYCDRSQTTSQRVNCEFVLYDESNSVHYIEYSSYCTL